MECRSSFSWLHFPTSSFIIYFYLPKEVSSLSSAKHLEILLYFWPLRRSIVFPAIPSLAISHLVTPKVCIAIFEVLVNTLHQGAANQIFIIQRVFWRGVVEELLWFISGSTNPKVIISHWLV